MVHEEPSQCMAIDCVPWSKLLEDPTAHRSVDDVPSMAVSWRDPLLGVGETFHERPSQCSTSGALPRGIHCHPAAHASSEPKARTSKSWFAPYSGSLLGFGLRTTDHAEPVQCSTTVWEVKVPAGPSAQPTAQA